VVNGILEVGAGSNMVMLLPTIPVSVTTNLSSDPAATVLPVILGERYPRWCQHWFMNVPSYVDVLRVY
jgi:hypothetical protein